MEENKNMTEKKFALEYDFNGSKWAVDLFANFWEEAEQKITALKETIILIGEIHEEIPEWRSQIENSNN